MRLWAGLDPDGETVGLGQVCIPAEVTDTVRGGAKSRRAMVSVKRDRFVQYRHG
jgi:hypothetical protein